MTSEIDTEKAYTMTNDNGVLMQFNRITLNVFSKKVNLKKPLCLIGLQTLFFSDDRILYFF